MFSLKNFLNAEHKNYVWVCIGTLTFTQDFVEDSYKPVWWANMKFFDKWDL